MDADEKDGSTGGEEHGGEDRPAHLLRDLVASPPPKGLDTVTAASEAAEKAEAQGATQVREHRVRTRAYELWEQEGRPDRHPSDFWLQAEAEVAREEE